MCKNIFGGNIYVRLKCYRVRSSHNLCSQLRGNIGYGPDSNVGIYPHLKLSSRRIMQNVGRPASFQHLPRNVKSLYNHNK